MELQPILFVHHFLLFSLFSSSPLALAFGTAGAIDWRRHGSPPTRTPLFVHLFTLHFACSLHVLFKQMWEASAHTRAGRLLSVCLVDTPVALLDATDDESPAMQMETQLPRSICRRHVCVCVWVCEVYPAGLGLEGSPVAC